MNNTAIVFKNQATITASGSAVVSVPAGVGAALILVLGANPTGTNPTLTVSIQELNPVDQTTGISTSITGVTHSAQGVEKLVLPGLNSGTYKVSWTIGGTAGPTFTKVDMMIVPSTNASAQNTTTAGVIANSNDVVQISCSGLGFVSTQITGTWSGTINFEATIDGSTWFALNSIGSQNTSVTSNSTAIFQANEYQSIRLRGSSWVSGSATINVEGNKAGGAVVVLNALTANPTDTSAAASLALVNDAATISCVGVTTVGVQSTGNLNGTIVFEARINSGAAWTSIPAYPIGSTDAAGVTSVAGNPLTGIWFVPVAGLYQMRVRASVATSGSAVVVLEGNATPNYVHAIQGPPNSSANAWPVTFATPSSAVDGLGSSSIGASPVQLGSAVCKIGAWIGASPGNSDYLYVGGSAVTSAAGANQGTPLAPGVAQFFECSNTNIYYVISGTTGQGVNVRPC